MAPAALMVEVNAVKEQYQVLGKGQEPVGSLGLVGLDVCDPEQ